AGAQDDVSAAAIDADINVVVVGAARDDEVAALEDGADGVGAGCVGGNLSEQAMLLVFRPRREVQRIGVAGGLAVAERQAPQVVDDDGAPRCLAEGALLDTRSRIVSMNATVAEIADEQIAAELAESLRRDDHAPGRVEVPARHQAPIEMAVRLEHVDETV